MRERTGSSASFLPRADFGFERERAGRPRPGRDRGFTLLELLVVLLLAALLIALAAPAGERFRASIARSTERDYILDQLADLGRQAMLRGRTFVVLSTGSDASVWDSSDADPASRGHAFESLSMGRYEAHVVDVPEGWDIAFDEPLVIRANGVCLGAELVLHYRGIVDVRVVLKPPYCRVDA